LLALLPLSFLLVSLSQASRLPRLKLSKLKWLLKPLKPKAMVKPKPSKLLKGLKKPLTKLKRALPKKPLRSNPVRRKSYPGP